MALYEIDGVDTADMDRGELLNVAMGLLGQRDALAEALREVVSASQDALLREEDGVIQDALDALKY